MSHANANSQTTTKKISNNESVIQPAVIQPPYTANTTANPMSQKLGLDTERETHSVNVLYSDQNSVNLLYIEKNSDADDIEGLLQNKGKIEILKILDILDRLKGKLSGDSHLVIRVSKAFKELYENYYAPKTHTLSPQTENIRRNILYIILDYLYETKFSKQNPKIQELFFKKCEELGYPIAETRKIEEEKPHIIRIHHIEEKAEEKEEKEQKEETEFKQKFREFEKFLNELIFTDDNFVKEKNGYPITKALAKKLFQYIEELVNLDSTSPEAEKLLREMEEFLQNYTLNEKYFANGIPNGVVYIPVGVYKDKILSRLTKIEKLLS